MAGILGEAIEDMVRDEVSRWSAQVLQRSVDVHVIEEFDDVVDIINDRERDDVTVIAWTEFDNMSVDDFYSFIEKLNTSNDGVWIEGHHPDGEKSDLFDTYEGHVADDYAIFFVHTVTTLGDKDA
jgi:hypothetical protein